MRAETIALALGGRKAGAGWIARCPAHDDRKPSLSIRDADGQVLVRCHAGCDQYAVIAALRDRGLWAGGSLHGRHPPLRAAAAKTQPAVLAERSAAAMAIWRATAPADGTLAEHYLASRGMVLPPPPSLRFHRGLKHRSGDVWPCMVALVTRGCDATPLAIHRTFLSRDGSGKAPVDPVKMMLGPCRGGAVQLGELAEVLMVGEGIETCLSAMQATGYPAWAALSTSGLRSLDLPPSVRDVVVLADGDDPGESAARETAFRWRRQDRRVRIARPPRGTDFNDVLLGRTVTKDGGGH